jgi:arginine exporter protein ArgO
MTDPLLAGVLAGYGIAMPVGAMSVLIVTLAARASLPTGIAGAMGVATADGIYALVAVIAGAALVRLLQPVAVPMQWVAAAVLIAIAAKGIVDALRRYRVATSVPEPDARNPVRTYLGLLGLTILNPLTIVYFAAMVLGQANDAWSAADSAVFVIGALVASASWQAFLALGGAFIGRVLTGVKGRLVTAFVGNGVILILALHLLWTTL